MKVLLTLSLLILLGLQFIFGQDTPNAKLIDVLESDFNDCDLSIRIHDYFLESEKDNSRILIVIYEDKENSVKKYIIENWVRSQIKFQKLPDERFIISFAKNEDATNSAIQFYKLPQNTEIPLFTEIPKDYKILNFSNGRLIASSIGELFSSLFNLDLYAKILKTNPNLIGKIVVYENNPRFRQKKIIKLVDELTNQYQVPKSQVRFYFSKQNVGFSYEDYWLVPKRRKS